MLNAMDAWKCGLYNSGCMLHSVSVAYSRSLQEVLYSYQTIPSFEGAKSVNRITGSLSLFGRRKGCRTSTDALNSKLLNGLSWAF